MNFPFYESTTLSKMYVMYFELYYKVRPFEFQAACDCIVLGRVERNQWHMAWTYLQLPIRQWGAGNVYLLVLSSWKVNIAENLIGGFQLLDLIITELKSHMTC